MNTSPGSPLFSRWIAAATIAVIFASLRAQAQPRVLDNCENAAGWRVIASDGVKASLSPTDGVDGRGLRLDFDFEAGAGYCIARKEIDLALPPNYRFSFQIRAEGPEGAKPPRNNLEFKLVDPSGDNVWWVNQRAYEFPSAWTPVRYRARQFQFAWGPSGGARMDRIGAIEFAIAASEGGRGSVFLDSLAFEELPESIAPAGATAMRASSGSLSSQGPPTDGVLGWTPDATDGSPWLELDLGRSCEIGGAVIEWSASAFATDYDLEVSQDRSQWETVASVRGGNGGRDWVAAPDSEGRYLRLAVRRRADPDAPVRVERLDVRDAAFGSTRNAFIREVARKSPRGWFPRQFHDEQAYWTIVGTPESSEEALLSEDGTLEVAKQGFTVEPMVVLNDDGAPRLLTWADVSATQRLEHGDLPIPSVLWNAPGFTLDITAFADGPQSQSRVIGQYTLRNSSPRRLQGALALAIRPFQVLPWWQDLNITGGVSPISRIEFDTSRVVVNGTRTIEAWSPAAFGASTFDGGEIAEHLATTGSPPAAQAIDDPSGLASGALLYNVDLAPGEQLTATISIPLGEGARPPATPASRPPEGYVQQRFRHVALAWSDRINQVGLELPPSGSRLVAAFRTMQAYILINRDGPAIQPGSRTYERSWIRDGSMTSAALLATGHPREAREFIEWYGPRQYDNGKVPCVVDSRGPDPVNEHDSTGQFIYAVRTYWAFTGDLEFVRQQMPRIEKGVEYLQSLSAQRRTGEYADGPDSVRACFGLVPESISHEGYSAKPMHSYWDSFFTIRGLSDAVELAQAIGRSDLVNRFSAARDAYETALYESIPLAMKVKGIDYIPGCVELGDFDATSTAIAVFPCGQLGKAPQSALQRTFDKYFEFFTRRRDGTAEWKDYTPYEVRLIGIFVRLGQPERAHELLDFFLDDQRPTAWNQWAEVVWKDERAPRFIGDMPHTWVGGDFLNAIRSMMVYERESDRSLVIAAGIKPQWAREAPGVRVRAFPTEYGPVTYSLRDDGDRTTIDLAGGLRTPPGGVVVRGVGTLRIKSATIDGEPAEVISEHEVRLPKPTGTVVIEYASE
ncbi:MAG: discoidin domain-containing protein [Phycisphaeraceae bacterium]|nr:discoidin domain-containing protein [Phycisphaeraceae bacterium]